MITTSRRQLIGMGASSALVALPACSVAKPAIIQGEITPQAFGAGNQDPVADTRAWNMAVEEAVRRGRPVRATGTYALRVPAASTWDWARRAGASTHIAVALKSGLSIEGDATIIVAPPETGAGESDMRHFLFGTDQNVQPGAVKDISIEGLTFDFRDELGPIHRLTYAVAVTGVDNLKRTNLKIISTGEQAGRGLLSENVRGRTDVGISHQNIVQGIYTRYERGVVMRNISFDTFNEAMDFDGPCWDVMLDTLSFKNGFREAQCIDTGGGSNWSVNNLVAENTGAIIYIYSKNKSFPTYEGWLNGGRSRTADFDPPSDMAIRNVRGVKVGWADRKGEAVRVGSYRNRGWLRQYSVQSPSPRNITLENWTLTDGGQIAVNDCDNIQMHHIVMDRAAAPDGDVEAAASIVLRDAPEVSGGQVTGSISNIEIRNPPGLAMSVVADAGLSISGVRIIDRAPSSSPAVRLRARLGGSETPRIDNLVIDGRSAMASAIDSQPPASTAEVQTALADERRQSRDSRRSRSRRAPARGRPGEQAPPNNRE